MKLTREEQEMLDGKRGEAPRVAMEGLVQLGEAFGAEDMVPIEYAHIHPGMAMYAKDVELMEELVRMGAKMAVPASANVMNVDTDNWQITGAPERLARLHQRGVDTHAKLGCASAMTCTPYWAGHWPTWNMHMTSIESTVTIFCNSVLGAKSNRDGFFSVYAGITGRYPRFGYHLDENRVGTHHFHIDAPLETVSDFSALGYHVGKIVGSDVPVFTGFPRRPTLDELDAMGATLATSGGVSLYIVPGVTPPFPTLESAFKGRKPKFEHSVRQTHLEAIYDDFGGTAGSAVDFIHLGCPHASFEEMKSFAALFAGKKVKSGVEAWVTTSRGVRDMARAAGIVQVIEDAGAKVITDTCPMSCHFAQTTSPDPDIQLPPPPMRTMVLDSAKQAKYVRDMVRCETLLTSAEAAVETAVTGRFVPRYGQRS
jgi:predicted aconitase